MRPFVLGLALAALPATAWANGRPPQAMTLHQRPGHPDDVVMGATFGALFSHDGGVTWQWMCEYAVGYGGTYDPDYAITPPGTVVATTFDGIQIDRDGCRFELSAFGETNASQVAVDATGAIVVAMVYQGDMTEIPPLPPDHKIYRSTNDGAAFDAGTAVGVGDEQWTGLEIAPSDPSRIYLVGYRFEAGAKTLVVYRSDNGGTSFAPEPVADFTVSEESVLQIAALDPNDPDRLLMRVTRWNAMDTADAFYLSTDGAQSWTNVLSLTDLARGVTFRANGNAVIGTARSGIYLSTTQGASFALVSAPHPDAGVTTGPEVTCLLERPDGELWACTNNYQADPFQFGLMKTTDLVSWTGVMTFQAGITGPVDCPIGTYQQDCCTVHTEACPAENTSTWCFIRSQLGIVAAPINCSPPGEPTAPPPGGGGCCRAGASPASTGLTTLVIAIGLTRRRRRSRVR